ncbi:MAG: hypothetical protein JKY81_11500 [Colwellia sp.]|nr:hypothetical protein [Colwellia sp.]
MTDEKEEKPVCGIIMPISSIDGCSSEHWADVQSIIKESVISAGFEANLVSDSDDVGIIQKRIVQNIYTNEVVVCDVSGKNPNVMFELGLRLAFDKPTIIVKDDTTDYSFDTSVIEHLSYPRDLRFSKIVSFKEKLKSKIIATLEKSKSDPNYSTFLKSFGEYKVAHLNTKEVSADAYVVEMINDLKDEVRLLRTQRKRSEAMGGGSYKKRDNRPPCLRTHIMEFCEKMAFLNLKIINGSFDLLVSHISNIEHVEECYESLNELEHDIQRIIRSPRFRDELRNLSQKSLELESSNSE